MKIPEQLEMPAPTAWPIVTAFGLTLVSAGFVTAASVSFLGAVLAIAGAVGWFRDLATANPVSYMIEAMRSLVITGWDMQALTLGFLCTVLFIVLGLVGSARLLKTRMART